jgi:purine nucleoside permease
VRSRRNVQSESLLEQHSEASTADAARIAVLVTASSLHRSTAEQLPA